MLRPLALIGILSFAAQIALATETRDSNEPRAFSIQLTTPSQRQLEARALDRNEKIDLLATFTTSSADMGMTGELILFPTDGILTGGTPYDGQDSTAAGAIRIPFKLDRSVASGITQIPFALIPTGKNGSSVYAKLILSSSESASANFLFAINEESGKVSQGDIKTMYRAQTKKFQKNTPLHSSVTKPSRVLKMNPRLINNESIEAMLPKLIEN